MSNKAEYFCKRPSFGLSPSQCLLQKADMAAEATALTVSQTIWRCSCDRVTTLRASATIQVNAGCSIAVRPLKSAERPLTKASSLYLLRPCFRTDQNQDKEAAHSFFPIRIFPLHLFPCLFPPSRTAFTLSFRTVDTATHLSYLSKS